MNACGLTDSMTSVVGQPAACPACGGSALLVNGPCVSCLLHQGLAADTAEVGESLEALLARVDIRDTDWTIGSYDILEEIGRGGMGVIYKARQRHSRRIVAMKRVLSYHGDCTETLVRFRREAEAAASLDHPNILPIYEVGEAEGLPFFTMKFAPGGSLHQAKHILRENPRHCVWLMARIARAVHYAHTQGILHRDLKPGNILLDGWREPMVSDFGLAKWLDASSDLTRTLTIFGTPGYIAPEQANGPSAAVGPAADIYSLGAILFDLLAGRPPFLGEHALSVMRQAAERPAPRLCSLTSSVDRDLETICAKCLEREPQCRYRTSSDFADDLERWLDGRPIAARRLSPTVRVWRWSRRNPSGAVGVAVCLSLAAAALGWHLRSAFLAEKVRQAEEAQHSIAVLPFLDLDAGRPDFETARGIAEALQERFRRIGPARIAFIDALPTTWTGIGSVDEIRAAAQHAGTRSVITGTFRTDAAGRVGSVRLIRENGVDLLGTWRLAAHELSGAAGEQLGSEVYARTGAAQQRRTSATAELNNLTQSYVNAGRLLLDRRTVSDMDRAIACFEAALAADPTSVEAASYLVMAAVGRNFLKTDPQLVQRATDLAKNMLERAEESSVAHRGLCFLYTFTGEYKAALEHGLRALECGDQSERAFGQIAFIWRQLGRPDRAIAWYKLAKVSRSQPADYEALLGDCWLTLGDDEKAARSYEAATRFRPDLPEGWLGLIHLELINGRIEEARALLSRKSAEFGAFPAAKELQARIEFSARNYEEAAKLYGTLFEADPLGGGTQQYGAISYCSAVVHLHKQMRMPNDAQDVYASCLAEAREDCAKAPNHPDALYRLAAMEATVGNTEQSLSRLAESIANGWLDYRSPQIDPRFDAVASEPRFQKLLSDLATKVAELRRQMPADEGL